MQYPADPPRPEEIIVVMRQAGKDRHGFRIRALIAVLWRGGLRISEALALNETDIDERRGSLLVRHGKGDRRREAGMDQFGLSSSPNGWPTACRCRPDRCSASSKDRPAGIDPSEIIDAVRARQQPLMSATAGLTL
jgi:Phage integrase family